MPNLHVLIFIAVVIFHHQSLLFALHWREMFDFPCETESGYIKGICMGSLTPPIIPELIITVEIHCYSLTSWRQTAVVSGVEDVLNLCEWPVPRLQSNTFNIWSPFGLFCRNLWLFRTRRPSWACKQEFPFISFAEGPMKCNVRGKDENDSRECDWWWRQPGEMKSAVLAEWRRRWVWKGTFSNQKSVVECYS